MVEGGVSILGTCCDLGKYPPPPRNSTWDPVGSKDLGLGFRAFRVYALGFRV